MTTTLEPSTLEPAPRPKRRRLRIAILAIVAVVLGFIGWRVYTAIAIYNSGEMVDVGGRSLFVSCSGSGSPTVILEHGLGTTAFEWRPIQDAVDETTQVCWTSRAGRGYSDRLASDEPRTMQDAVDDLTAALGTANIEPPYVLVGHSAGGLSIRLFADQHPGEVVGMVLVDATHEDMLTRTEQSLSPEAWNALEAIWADNAENLDLAASSAQVGAIGDLGDMPLIVLDAGLEESDDPPPGVSDSVAEELQAMWPTLNTELQRELAELSTNSTYIVVEDAGHFIQNDRPDAVIDAIESILAQVR